MATREAYGKTLAKLIVEHDDLFVLDADLTKSTKTIEAKKARPEHHFNMGIAEGNSKTLAKLIVEHDDLFVLDADLTKSTKTIEAKKARPEHHFNMGIAEGNMMAVAAGMAASNKVVYASSFAMFAAGRAFEQIRNSICYPNLNVKVCATHAGISVWLHLIK